MDNMNYENTYIGLTIGPIFKTINYAKKTGELWGSSYMFSYIMKNIIKELISNKRIKDSFIVPCVTDLTIFETGNEVGLFHDRFIFKSNKGDFEKVNNIVEKVKMNFKEKVFEKLQNIYEKELEKFEKDKEANPKLEKPKEPYKKTVEEYIDNYLKIYFVEIEVDPKDQNEDERNIIFKMSKYLDSIELKEQFVDEEESKYLFEILNNRYIKESFLTEDAYGDSGPKEGYRSLLNIAVSELDITKLCTEKKEENEDEKIIKLISNLEKDKKNKIKKYHEYVAIVQVDGDFMGKRIAQFHLRSESDNKFKEYVDFSKKLLKHAQESHKIIKKYGGFTIFAGGDDLLFIAPLSNKNQNIFKLIDSISEQFNEKFKLDDREEVSTTLSFGVAIVHYKYPLYFALEEARNLLFGQAKNFKFKDKDKDIEKNAIAFKVIKSSGESFGTVVGKSSTSYKAFNELFNKTCQSSNENKKVQNYLKSIHIKLLKDKVILNRIGKNKDMLKNYFSNNFDESFHKESDIKKYIDLIIEFINKIYIETEEYEIINDRCINQIYSYLKFIKFMDEKSDLKDLKGDIKDKEKGDNNG